MAIRYQMGFLSCRIVLPVSMDTLLPPEPQSTTKETIQILKYSDKHLNVCLVFFFFLVMEGIPVSVEEPKPGSLCDLTSCTHSLLSRTDPSPSFSLRGALRCIHKRVLFSCSPPCSPTTGENKVGGAEEGGRAPWCDGVGGQI